MDTQMRVPQGEFSLRRLPSPSREPLRAWDAADEYLLQELEGEGLIENSRILLLNDAFGALATALSRYQPSAMSDSWLSQQATRLNLEANAVGPERVTLLTSLQAPASDIDYLLIKIPKTLALLEYQLLLLRQRMSADTRVIAAGMVKNLPSSVWTLLERLVGPVTTSLAKKKARLLYARPESIAKPAENPYPICYRLENTDLMLCNHANVFSRERLDIGTRLMLRHLPDGSSYRDIIDLGCGNGVLGLILAKRYPDARLRFVDESFMATASAEDNFKRAFPSRPAEFVTTDCLEGISPQSADCIVCNPPFHQQHAVGDHIAWRMFRQSFRTLRRGGELRVVGNRHLGYHNSLKKLFGNCELVASNNKFVILSAHK